MTKTFLFFLGSFLSSFLGFFLVPSAFADTESERVPSITVKGSCVREVAPDQTEVSVGIMAVTPDAATAAAKTAPVYERLLKKIKSLELKNTEYATTDLGVYPKITWERDKEIQRGYEAYYAFSVVTGDMDRVGEIFKAAKELGANKVIGPRPRISKALRKSQYELCLDEAIQNAKAKASVMAKALGVNIKNKAIVTEDVYSSDFGGYTSLSVASNAKSFAPTVETKKEDISVKVQATFLIE